MHIAVLMTLLMLTCAAGADLYYVEEIANSGAVKKSKYTTVNEVYIKGRRQKVRSTIKADKKAARALEKRGQILDTSTILRLDSRKLYSVNHVAKTFTSKKLPDPTPAAKASTFPAPPDIKFRVKELEGSKKINGIVCRKVAVEMRARYTRPGSQTVRKENRYLYQAWMANDFPGIEEIVAFDRALSQTSSQAPITGGGLQQLRDVVENYDELAEKVGALDGFPMQSQIKVFSKSGSGKEKQIFQITRKVKSLSASTIPSSEFRVAKGFKRASK